MSVKLVPFLRRLSPEIPDIRYCVITFHPRKRPVGSVKIYKDLYEYSRKKANISLRHEDRKKKVQLDHDSLVYTEAMYIEIGLQ